MEHTNNMEIAVTDDNLYQTMQDSNLDDATIRRMKNRERQRRYRARKRLEADTMNEITYPSLKRHEGNANNMQMVPVPQEVYYTSNNGSKAASPDGQLVLARINELPLVVTTTPNIETRVPSRRDWKSDARRANSEEHDNRRFSLDIGSKMGSFPLGSCRMYLYIVIIMVSLVFLFLKVAKCRRVVRDEETGKPRQGTEVEGSSTLEVVDCCSSLLKIDCCC